MANPNASTSYNDWDRHPSNNPNRKTLDDLGDKILFDFNPYPSSPTAYNQVQKLGAGAKGGGGANDPEFWMNFVQTCVFPVLEGWDHDGTTPVYVRKAARIPYLVVDAEGQLTIDHLLIGYVQPSGSATAASPPDWGFNPPLKDAARLAQLIVTDYYPSHASIASLWGKCCVPSDWPDSFDENPVPRVGYGLNVRPRPWRFRSAQHQVEKSVLMHHAAKFGNTYKLGKILIGYEGGGGW